MVKTITKGAFSINKIKMWKENQDSMFCTFAGMKSLMNSKLCNFITSREQIKTPQKFLQDTFSIKSLKLCHKNWGEFLNSGSLSIRGNWILEVYFKNG